MKKFHFTLDAVRTLRQRQEQKALEHYAQCLAARQQALLRLEDVESELSACCERLRGQLAAVCLAVEAAQAHEFRHWLTRRRDECVTAVHTAERRVNAALQGVLQARQQREIVDKCFDKQKAVHAHEETRQDQKFLDDLAGRRVNGVLAWRPNETTS